MNLQATCTNSKSLMAADTLVVLLLASTSAAILADPPTPRCAAATTERRHYLDRSVGRYTALVAQRSTSCCMMALDDDDDARAKPPPTPDDSTAGMTSQLARVVDLVSSAAALAGTIVFQFFGAAAALGIVLNLSGWGYRISAEDGLEINTLSNLRTSAAERKFLREYGSQDYSDRPHSFLDRPF